MNRKNHWENIYTEKSPLKVSWYQKEPLLSLELVSNSKLDKNAAIIDVGGGTSSLVGLMLDEGYSNITVLDMSSTALGIAKHRLSERSNLVKWIEVDITEFNPYINTIYGTTEQCFIFLQMYRIRISTLMY